MKRKPSEHPRACSWYDKILARAATLTRIIIAVLRVVDWWQHHRR